MRRSIHVMLYQDAVLEHGYLRPVAVLPDDHDPLHRLAPGQELGLGDDRRAAAPGVTALPASLPLGFEPRRPLDGLDVRRAVGACRAHVNHRVRRVVGLWRRGLRIRSAAPTAAPAPCRWLCLGRAGGACRLLGGNRAADGGRVSAGPGLALRAAGLGPGFVVGASRDSPRRPDARTRQPGRLAWRPARCRTAPRPRSRPPGPWPVAAEPAGTLPRWPGRDSSPPSGAGRRAAARPAAAPGRLWPR